MKFFDNIKRMFGQRLLKTKLQTPRTSQVHNFGDARSIAIIYKEKGESFYILVKQYVKYLSAEHGIREVMAMCYIENKKDIPYYHVHKLKFDYFTSAELTWRMEPNCDQVTNFVKQNFDILIDLEKEPCLPLRFILAESQAAFKVGYYHPDNEPFYDMMLASGQNDTFDEYIKQVNHYLTLINRQDARA